MVKYGLDYTRCRWILPLLLGIGVIFGIIALAGRGWLESQTLPYVHRASLWESCSRSNPGGEWSCESLMNYAWGRAAAATYLVGFILLVICFALAIIAFAIDTLRFNFIRGIGGLLFVAAVFSIMGLVIYPVKFSTEIEMTGINMFSWAYGFGWTTAIMEICLGFFFCCLPNYEDQILESIVSLWDAPSISAALSTSGVGHWSIQGTTFKIVLLFITNVLVRGWVAIKMEVVKNFRIETFPTGKTRFG